MKEIIQVSDEYYIHATSPLAAPTTRVLKHNETFAVFDHTGDIQPLGFGEQGLYHEGTRFLSRFVFRVAEMRPLLLSSNVTEDNTLLTVDLTNPDLPNSGLRQETVHFLRSTFLLEDTCYERLRVRNYGVEPVRLGISYEFEADFRDIFEVRGIRRERRGESHPPRLEDSAVVLAYDGLDGVRRSTRVTFGTVPSDLGAGGARFEVDIGPAGEWELDLSVGCGTGVAARHDGAPARARNPRRAGHDDALRRAREERLAAEAGESGHIETSNQQVNDWIQRARADVQMMVTQTHDASYIYAGVPWYSTVFGRDGIISALEVLRTRPQLAAGVLRYLAANQAEAVDPESDAEPGKIVHEMRGGEMAVLGEIPFGRYYGSVDSTPLFVMLAGAYYRRTGDEALVRELWPNIERALRWIDEYGDADGDGFVEYARHSERGLLQQGWKDSFDSVFHADGSAAEPPIALAEVQGYVYAAKRSASRLAALLGENERAFELERDASRLRDAFDSAFWCEEIGTYALALDGEKRQCRVRTSNAGHCLFTGIALPERAAAVGATLLAPDSFSGWGIRTVSAREVRYNPMSYHNGSVWPHDNALIAEGLARYGMHTEALAVLGGMFDASQFFDLRRLPELFCGFDRRPREGPTLYPVACSPQSWAAAAVFMLLGACLGLTVDGARSRVRFDSPMLPPFIEEMRITDLRVGDATVDLHLHRYPDDVGIHVGRRQGEVDVVIVK